jgi:hypothetical protein
MNSSPLELPLAEIYDRKMARALIRKCNISTNIKRVGICDIQQHPRKKIMMQKETIERLF